MFEEENEADLKDQLDFNLSLEAPMFTGMQIFFKEEWIRTACCLLLRNILRLHSFNILHHRRKDVYGC